MAHRLGSQPQGDPRYGTHVGHVAFIEEDERVFAQTVVRFLERR